MNNQMIQFDNFHLHKFEKQEERIDNSYACSCGVRVQLTHELPPDAEKKLTETEGFPLQDLPPGTEGVFYAQNGFGVGFRIPTLEDLLAQATQARDFWNTQIEAINKEIEERDNKILDLTGDDEFPDIIFDA